MRQATPVYISEKLRLLKSGNRFNSPSFGERLKMNEGTLTSNFDN